MNIRAMSFTTLSTAVAFLGMSLAPHAATAAFTVFGNGMAQLCADTARNMERGLMPPPQSIETCTMAIENEDLRQRDRAGTYINRGTLYLARGGYREAKQDFDSAVALMPALGEAYTNRGAALVGLQLYNDAIADIDRGLAEEALDNIPAAYRDYARAAELKPGWAPPINELSRFTVGTRRS